MYFWGELIIWHFYFGAYYFYLTTQVGIADQIAIRSYVLGKGAKSSKSACKILNK